MVALPVVLTYVPGAHVDHAVHDEAFVVELYVPVAHAAHCRSCVALPAETSYCPEVQLVFVVHSVAALPS